MGIKQIFQEGMREFKRQSALRKEKRNLSQKEKLLSEQLTETGKKAWESKMDIDNYGNSKELITNAQDQMDELNTRLSDLDKQKQELENKKKEENESFDSQRKEVEEQKKGVDTRLNNEKKQLREAQREKDNAESRLKLIDKEEEQLKTKSGAPETSEEEKSQIREKLQAFETEKQNLGKKQDEASGIIKSTEEKIKPVEAESAKHQKEIDLIRTEQKKVIGELDESLSKVNKDISDDKSTLTEVTKEQDGNFEQLGEKLAGAQVSDEAVATELEAVNTTKKEMEDIQVDIQALEHQGTAASRSALWKMIGLIFAGAAAVVVIIILLTMLFGSDKKKEEDSLVSVLSKAQKTTTTTEAEIIKQFSKKMIEKKLKEDAEKSGDKEEKAPKTLEEAQKKMDEATAKIKEESEKQYGKKIVVTDKETFLSVLPEITGWKMEDTSYNKGNFGQLESSNFECTYASPAGQKVSVHITDTATASMALRTYKMFFQMNMSKENENGYEKISTYKNISVIEKFTKGEPPEASFIFIIRDRYLVELRNKGENCIALLKEFITEFDLSKLQ